MKTQDPNSPVKEVRWQDKQVVIDVAGDVDMGHSAAFQQCLSDVMAKAPAHVILDLAGVEYMDSSGIASLVKLHSQAKAAGAALSLVAVHRNVQSILQITHLDGMFKVFDTAEEAIASA